MTTVFTKKSNESDVICSPMCIGNSNLPTEYLEKLINLVKLVQIPNAKQSKAPWLSNS